MVMKKIKTILLALSKVLNLVVWLTHRMRFTSHEVAGAPKRESNTTHKTSVSISGEYRKEDNERNGNSSRS